MEAYQIRCWLANWVYSHPKRSWANACTLWYQSAQAL